MRSIKYCKVHKSKDVESCVRYHHPNSIRTTRHYQLHVNNVRVQLGALQCFLGEEELCSGMAEPEQEERFENPDVAIPELDCGLTPGNYFDYAGQDVALQAEWDLVDNLAAGSFFEDATFPSDARSLYFDPLHPPKGALPGVSIKWPRIAAGEVMDCDAPVFCTGNPDCSMIEQGALGNSYFINSLRLLSCFPKHITSLLVSDKLAAKGIYTFRFYKAGQWRYVHIDDRIPSRQSGKVNFARNENPNETFAMLLEKAYAKLHGCYEALVHGLIEKTVLDLTSAADCKVRRNELQYSVDLDNIVDETWAFLEDNLKNDRLVGCAKLVPDPYSERLESRQGITVGCMYQVLDVQVATAYPTEDLDRLTIGMVCVRNLQKHQGFFNGAWSIGHQNWVMYKEIGLNLRRRTREIMFHRGLGLDPNEKNEDDELINFKDDEFFDNEDRTGIDQFLSLEQPDEPDEMTAAFLGRANLLSPQPYEKDIHWMQIDHFVDIFNRTYSVSDLSGFGTNAINMVQADGRKGTDDSLLPKSSSDHVEKVKPVETKRFYSKWLPGDYLNGSGGPPLVLGDFNADEKKRAKKEADDIELDANLAKSLKSMDDAMNFADPASNDEAIAAAKRLNLEENINVCQREGEEVPEATEGKREEEDVPEVQEGAGFKVFDPPEDDDEDEDKDKKADGGSSAEDISSKGGENIFGPYGKTIEVNEDFTDNPMYPFSVNEPSTVCITLYQPDRRWSVGRLGEEPRDITSSEFASRGERLGACMRYGDSGIGFVVVRLFGLKMRCTEFKLRKMVATSDYLCFTNAANCSAKLLPGRYAVIPYTNKVVDDPTDYILHFHYSKGAVELEVTDVIEQRLKDDIISDDDSDGEEEYDDDSDEDAKMTPEELDARDEQRVIGRQLKKFVSLDIKPPLPWTPQMWEYSEDTEELGVVSIFDEVGDLARYTSSLRTEIKKLQHTVDTLKLYNQAAPKEVDDKKKKSDRYGNSPSRKGGASRESSRQGSRGSPSR